MKHKHAEVIKAFVDGKECEGWFEYSKKWFLIATLIDFDNFGTVRIKPEPKPDVVKYLVDIKNGWLETHSASLAEEGAIRIVRDGETGKIKDVQVIR
jgi:hypothetical protein